MDDQILELMRDRFDRLDAELSSINTTISEHVKKDEFYWKKLDAAEGQLSLIKWVMGSISLSGVLGWLFNKFGSH